MKGSASISHDQDYLSFECTQCKREFILLSVVRGEKTCTVIEQPEYDYCPFCGKKYEDEVR